MTRVWEKGGSVGRGSMRVAILGLGAGIRLLSGLAAVSARPPYLGRLAGGVR